MVFTERLSSIISRKLKHYLPDRTKRLLMLGSLSGCIYGKTTFDKKTIRKLNEVLSLSHSDNALVFPMQLIKVVWRKHDIETVLYSMKTKTSPEFENYFARQLVERIPLCLQYSTYQEMFEDIKKLLENKPITA